MATGNTGSSKSKVKKRTATDSEVVEIPSNQEQLPPTDPEIISNEDISLLPVEALPVEALEDGEEISPSELILDDGKAISLAAPADVGEEKDSEDSDKKPPKTTALTRYDPLTAYLAEIRKHPPLDRETETALAEKYLQSQDRDAAYRLIAGNLWLVVKIAREYERAARTLLDLIQEGNIGLMEAVKNFDPFRGVRFPSYATWWIRAYIIRYLIANWRMVKIGTTQAQRKLFFNLKREKERIEKMGFTAAPKLLADNLNVRESDVIEMEQRLAGADVSVDAPLQPGSEGDLHALLPSHTANAEEALALRQTRNSIKECFEEFVKTLSKKERIIFFARLLTEEKETLQEVAEELSLSRERIRQIENRLKEKLKAFMLHRFGSDIESLGIGQMGAK